MADVNYAAFSLIAKPAITITKTLNNRFTARAYHASSPSKPANLRQRRNSLRPKILTEPFSPPRVNPSVDPSTPREAPLTERNDESVSVVSMGDDRAAEGLLGEAAGRSLAARYGLYLIGAFVFQTVFAVWILGNGGSNEKDEVLDSSDSDREASLVNGNRKALGSNVVQLGEKIDEIRAMARQARREEKRNGTGDENSSSRSRVGIEKEIGNRLMKLQKGLNSSGNKLGARSEAKRGGESLVFRKNLRFRSSPAELGESPEPKGFGGFEKKKASKGSSSSDEAAALSEGENGDIRKVKLSENGHKKPGTGRVTPAKKSGNGVVQASRLGKASAELAQSDTSRASRREKDQVFMEENREDSGEHLVSSGNGSSRRNEPETKSTLSKLLHNQPSIGADMWWLNLPYVLVVLMHRDSDPEGVEGFYTLKLDTESQNQEESSYTVAFEDRGDANNFCFLLESFFEDLGDVRADIVPLSVKELEAAVNSGKWKVIVVRKGQLRLYAGQPFADVEMALHALVEQTQRAL